MTRYHDDVIMTRYHDALSWRVIMTRRYHDGLSWRVNMTRYHDTLSWRVMTWLLFLHFVSGRLREDLGYDTSHHITKNFVLGPIDNRF